MQQNKKKQKAKRFLSYKAMKTQIQGYGFSYSFVDFMKVSFFVFAGIIIMGYLYSLKKEAIIICLLTVLIMLPFIIVSQFRYLYEQQKFTDTVEYMEQMIYAFKKRPKILLSLKETHEVVTGNMQEAVGRAIAYIETGVYKENLYKEAFALIEEEYACERIEALHKFLRQVEQEGGEYQEAINILLDDIKAWSAMTYEFQKDIKSVKNKITLSIGLALFICWSIGRLASTLDQSFEGGLKINENIAYQAATTFVVICMMLLYTVVQSKMNGNWMAVTNKSLEVKIRKDYELSIHGTVKRLRKKFLPLCILMVAVAAYGILIKSTAIIVAGLGGAFLMWVQPKSKLKAAQKRTMREINKTFPAWMRNLALNLQRENVQVAISNSISEAPYILQTPLLELKKELEEDPISIRPYTRFLAEFDLPEVSSAMKMLYSLNAGNKKDVAAQVNTIVERNTKMLEKAERIKQEDVTALTGFMVALPMMISLVKLVTDMLLLIFYFLEAVNI